MAGSPSTSFPRNYTPDSQHRATMALNRVCEHLCFILSYVVHPLARQIASLLYSISFYERFHRNALLLYSGRNLYVYSFASFQ